MTKISQLSSIGDSLAVDDQFLIRDVDDGTTPNKSVTVSGIARSLPLGTAAIPALAFASDKNTGLYSPGADQVAITTGGTGRLFIDSSGRLLVGTSAARANFDASSSLLTPQFQLEGTTASNSSLSIVRNSASGSAWLFLARSKGTALGSTDIVASGDTIAEVSFNAADGTNFVEAANISAQVDGTPGANDMPGRLIFSTTADGAASPTERMRINSSGHVGIGTTAPRFSLSLGDITGASTSTPQTIDLGGTYSSTAGANPKLRLYWDNSNSIGFGVSLNQLDYICNTGTSHVFHIGATERARIDSSGRLLVGTSSYYDQGVTGDSALLIANTTLGHIAATTWSATNLGAYLTLGRSRSGTIGTNTAVADNDELGVIVFAGDNGSNLTNKFAQISAFVDGTPGVSDNPGRLVFSTTADGASSPTERMVIKADGKVGIGTSSPSDVIDLVGNIRISTNKTDNTNKLAILLADQYASNTETEGATLLLGSFTSTANSIRIGGSGSSYNAATDIRLFTAADTTTRSGTERMIIDSSGRVGIGTSSPNYLIHGGTVDATAYTSTSAALAVPANTISYIANTDTTTNNTGCFFAIGAAGTSSSSIWYTGVDGGTTAYSGSYVIGHRTGTTAYAERLRIDSSGRLLVGTSTAGASRNIYGGLELEQSQTGNNAWAHFTQYGNSYTNRGARLYLNFTLGTSAGSATAVTTEDELGAIHFRGANGTTFQSAAEIRGETDTGTISGTSMPGRLVFSTTADGASSPTERMRIDSAGRVGIGATSPQANGLEIARVAGGTENCELFITSGATSGQSIIGLGDSTNRYVNHIVADQSDNSIRFHTAASGLGVSERLRIDSSGRLLVGTSASATTAASFTPGLQVADSGAAAAISVGRYSANASQPQFAFQKSRGAIGVQTAVIADDNLGQISFEGSDGTSFRLAATITGSVDGAVSGAGAADMPGRLVFSTTADGASSPTEAMRINNQRELLIGTTTRTANGGVLQVSNGITFPATQSACSDANTLDDYEEGNWTPTAIGSSTAGTASYTVQVGTYTKIGQQVTVSFHILYTGGTGSGNLRVSGLPFTSANVTNRNFFGAGALSDIAATASNQVYIANTPNTSQLVIDQFPIAGGATSSVAYDAAGRIQGTLTYFA